jgi:hypothetical protein
MVFYPGYMGYDTTARNRASEAKTEAHRASSEAREVRSEIERLLMLTEALWTLLKEEHGWEDEALMEKLREIDLRDGRIDGKVATSPPRYCPSCGKVLQKKKPLCLYCAAPVDPDPFER